jgi:propionyl-CoA synthetase
MGKYAEQHKRSIENPDQYWGEQAEELHWMTRWDKVLDDSKAPFFRWFVGGETNLCYNAVDRHVEQGKGDKPAIIWESPEVGESRTYTFSQLKDEVQKCAAGLRELGVSKGDRVLIYLPMVPEALISMLGCVRIGAVHSVVFAGFSFDSLADRIDDAKPKAIITADASTRKGKVIALKEIVDNALDRSPVEKALVLNRNIKPYEPVSGRDVDWHELMARHEGAEEPCVPLESTHPSYILYTSGTTGKPKGVVRDTGGYMVALHASMSQVYGVGQDDVYWSTSDIGWVVGHSYIVYGPLLKGVPTVVFEGTPDDPNPGIWWDIVEKHNVTVVFSAPTAMRMLRKFPEHWITSHDLSKLRTIFLAGEPLDDATYEWAHKTLGTTIVDHYWQTESGWSILANSVGIEKLPIKPGSPTKPAMGWKVAVVDDQGKPVDPNTKGYLVAYPPLPPGSLLTVWGDDERYLDSYWRKFPGMLYATGDFALVDDDGYYFVMGRADEVINVAGHRLGTREVEEVISAHPAVAEASSIGIADEVKGQAIAAFVVLKQDQKPDDETKKSIVGAVREKIGAIATPKRLEFVDSLPKTRSGKVMRRVLKAICEGKDIGDVSTIEDRSSVEEIRDAVEE